MHRPPATRVNKLPHALAVIQEVFAASACQRDGTSQTPSCPTAAAVASESISVRMKQRKASSGSHTIGSPRTLKLVLMITGQPVRS